MATNRSFAQGPDVDTVAGNGLLHRRMFLMAGTAVGASRASTALPDSAGAGAFPGPPLRKLSGGGVVGCAPPPENEEGWSDAGRPPRPRPDTRRTPRPTLA